MKKTIKNKILLSVFILFILYFGFLHFKIIENSNFDSSNKADFVIILGARVKGTIPSLSLQYRIDAAAEYLTMHKETIAIASGGKGKGEDISEAEAIKRGLISRGIEESRIISEARSTNTIENISFSKKLIPVNLKKGLLVSNDFHLYRAKMIATDLGLHVNGLPAKTPTISIPKSYSREYLAITKYFLKNMMKYSDF